MKMTRPHTASGYKRRMRMASQQEYTNQFGSFRKPTYSRKNEPAYSDIHMEDKENTEPIFMNEEWQDAHLQSQYHEYAILMQMYLKKRKATMKKKTVQERQQEQKRIDTRCDLLLEKCDTAFYCIYKNAKEKYPEWYASNKNWVKEELAKLDMRMKEYKGKLSSVSKEERQTKRETKKRAKEEAAKRKRDEMIAAGRARAKKNAQLKKQRRKSRSSTSTPTTEKAKRSKMTQMKDDVQEFQSAQAFGILCRILMRMNQLNHADAAADPSSPQYQSYDTQFKNIIMSIEGLYSTYPSFELMMTFLSRFLYARYKETKKDEINRRIETSLQALKQKEVKASYDHVAQALSLDLSTKINQLPSSQYGKTIQQALESAAAAKCQLAYYYLGHFYAKGIYVKKVDEKLAFEYFKLGSMNSALAPGYPFAQYEYGLMLKKGFSSQEPQYEAALHMFKAASQHGLRKAALQLGQMILYGLGCAQNFKKAMSFLRDPAAARDPLACYYMGECYRNLNALENARSWYEKSASLGMERASHKLSLYWPESDPIQVLDDEDDVSSSPFVTDDEAPSSMEALLLENDQLISENEQLVSENEQLVNENTALVEQNQHLQQVHQTVLDENEILSAKVAELQRQLDRLSV